MIVASVVVNWNRRDDTLACLGALLAQRGPGVTHRLLLVDNGSTDGSVAAVRSAFPDVEAIALPENRGYAPAANVGLRRALALSADFTWLVNNDTWAGPELLAALLAPFEAEDVGMTAPTVYLMSDPTRVWPSAGRRRRLTLAGLDTTADPPTREPYDVDWATGCCLLVRSAVWRDVGLFDPRFAFYYEDHDLCLRAKGAGWRILHVPRASIRHKVAASTGEGSPRQLYLLGRASVPYYWRHTRGAHRALIVAYRAGSLVRTMLRCLARGQGRAALAYGRGLADGIRDVHGSISRPWDAWHPS